MCTKDANQSCSIYDRVIAERYSFHCPKSQREQTLTCIPTRNISTGTIATVAVVCCGLYAPAVINECMLRLFFILKGILTRKIPNKCPSLPPPPFRFATTRERIMNPGVQSMTILTHYPDAGRFWVSLYKS